MQAYPIFLQYCSLNIANKPEVLYDSFIMYTELYRFLPQASLPLSQMYSTHLLITMINLLSADQSLILLTHWACSKCVSYTRMLATADYYDCLYFWNMHSRLPQANPYHNPAAWLQGAGSSTALPCRIAWSSQTPLVCDAGLPILGMGGWEHGRHGAVLHLVQLLTAGLAPGKSLHLRSMEASIYAGAVQFSQFY